MPYCAKCGAELRPNARFCHKCGAPVTVEATFDPAKRKEGWVKASYLLDWAKSLCPVEPFDEELKKMQEATQIKELERTSFNIGFAVSLLLCKWHLFMRGEEDAARILKGFFEKLFSK